MSGAVLAPGRFQGRFRAAGGRSVLALLAVVVASGVGASAWLIPGPVESTFIAVRQGDAEAARRALRAATAPGGRISAGETAPLIDLALEFGEVSTAIEVLRRFLDRNPDNVDALRRLAELQIQAHRLEDMAATSERLFDLTGDPEALREAADIYTSRRMAAPRLRALQRLAAIGRADDGDIAELAHRLAASGDVDGALAAVFGHVKAQETKPLADTLIGLAAALSVGRPDEEALARRIGGLISERRAADALQAVLHTYGSRRRPDLSLVAAGVLSADMQAQPDIALALARLETAQGLTATALARLDDAAGKGRLPDAGRSLLLELVLLRGDLERAVRLAADLPPEPLAPWVAERFVQEAYDAGRPGLLGRVREVQLAGAPAAAAVGALARGDRAGALRAANVALGEPTLLTRSGAPFIAALRTLGLEGQAVQRLLAELPGGKLGPNGPRLLVDLLAAVPAQSDAVLAGLLAARDTQPGAGEAWAVLASQGGQGARVLAWLRGSPEISTPALLELLRQAASRTDPGLASLTASLLASRGDLPPGWSAAEVRATAALASGPTPGAVRAALDALATSVPEARIRLAELLAGGTGFMEAARALPGLRQHPAAAALARDAETGAQTANTRAAYLTILVAIAPDLAIPLLTADAGNPRLSTLHATGLLALGRTDEAETVLRRLLRASSASVGEAALYQVRAAVSPAAALAVLRLGAAERGGSWVNAYEEALERLGRRDELLTLLRQRAADGSRSRKERAATASRLLELGDRAGAISALRALAAGLPPAAPEVQQLLYIWGPTASAEGIGWTRQRALAAPAAELPKWLEHLAYLGDPAAVMDAVEARPQALASDARVVAAYAAAAVSARATGRAAAPLARAGVAAAEPAALKALAQAAADTEQEGLSRRIALRAATARPDDGEALLLAARGAANARRSAEAAGLFTRLLALGPQPPDVLLDAGEALATQGRKAEAARQFQAALDALPAGAGPPAKQRQRARALRLLGRNDEAATLLRALLATTPGDPGLRADLLQLGDG